MPDAYEIRVEAERIIGEDRVPMDVLLDLIRDFGDDPCYGKEPTDAEMAQINPFAL